MILHHLKINLRVLSAILIMLITPVRSGHAADGFMLCTPERGMKFSAKILSGNSNLKWAGPHAPKDQMLYLIEKNDETMKWGRDCILPKRDPAALVGTPCVKHLVIINRYTLEYFYLYPVNGMSTQQGQCRFAEEKKLF